MASSRARHTWLGSDRRLARTVARPITRFLHVEAASGVLLLAAAVVALVWVNSPWSASYHDLWTTDVALTVGRHTLDADLRHWVNDGLMALFFFVLGLEIKQELVSGQLASVRAAAVPALGALGGMVVPAAIYLAVNHGGPGAGGWGIPIATDVAFSLGVLALLGSRAPAGLKVLLLGLAIVDDIGAIVVIAVFYAAHLALGWLALGAAGLAVVAVLRRLRVWYLPVYAALGVGIWWCTWESGVHATIAGVALGLLTPARPLMDDVDADRIAAELSADTDVDAAEVRDISFRLRESVPVAERLADVLHPWTSYVIVPLFALANAGVELSRHRLADAATSRITIGVVVGLVVGKLVGVTAAIGVGTRAGPGEVPEGVTGRHVVGMAALAGIGFTVSLFVAALAFEDDPARLDQAKLGVLAASMTAAALGAVILRSAPPAGDEP
ncbi:MAG TPA: Na+/H+ antiporter NhaA [Acidimicrobiales bacterium]